MDTADTDAVLRWRSSPDILDQMFSEQVPTRQGHLEWLAAIRRHGDRHEFMILESASDRAIGTIGLSKIDRLNRNAEYGILIGEPEARRRGYAREASNLILRYGFGELNLNRVYLQVFMDNLPAIKLYNRLGFRVEGILRQAAWKRGAFRDVQVMAILRDEWTNA